MQMKPKFIVVCILLMVSSKNNAMFDDAILIVPAQEATKKESSSWSLHQAVNCQEVEIVAQLLKKGESLDSFDTQGESALCKAARNGNVQIAQMLKDAGANVNVTTGELQKNRLITARSPLFCALQGKHALVAEKQALFIRWLVEHNATLLPEEMRMESLVCANPALVSTLIKTLNIKFSTKSGPQLFPFSESTR